MEGELYLVQLSHRAAKAGPEVGGGPGQHHRIQQSSRIHPQTRELGGQQGSQAPCRARGLDVDPQLVGALRQAEAGCRRFSASSAKP